MTPKYFYAAGPGNAGTGNCGEGVHVIKEIIDRGMWQEHGWLKLWDADGWE